MFNRDNVLIFTYSDINDADSIPTAGVIGIISFWWTFCFLALGSMLIIPIGMVYPEIAQSAISFWVAAMVITVIPASIPILDTSIRLLVSDITDSDVDTGSLIMDRIRGRNVSKIYSLEKVSPFRLLVHDFFFLLSVVFQYSIVLTVGITIVMILGLTGSMIVGSIVGTLAALRWSAKTTYRTFKKLNQHIADPNAHTKNTKE